MVIKTLESALADLKDEKGEKVAKARESLTALLASARKVVEAAKKEGESESEAEAESKESETETESKPEPDPKDDEAMEAEAAKAKSAEAAAMFEKGHGMIAKALAMGHKAPAAESAKEAEGEAEAESESESKKESETEAKESKRLAVVGLLREAKLDEELVDMVEVIALPLKEARAHIAKVKKMSEALAKKIVRTLEAPAGHGPKAGRVGDGSDNMAAFADLTK